MIAYNYDIIAGETLIGRIQRSLEHDPVRDVVKSIIGVHGRGAELIDMILLD